jgi:hypothetical protein
VETADSAASGGAGRGRHFFWLSMGGLSKGSSVTMSHDHQFTSTRLNQLRHLAMFIVITMTAIVWPFATTYAAQQHFPSPEDAARALVAAARTNDLQAAIAILGANARPIIFSGDNIADASSRARFVARYDEMHRFVTMANGEQVLYVGAENYPFPIPLRQDSAGWYFDTATGEREILYRRVGRNELNAIDVMRMLVDAQREYFQQLHDGFGVHQFASRIISTPGKHDGLYWPIEAGQPESPVGPYLAKASAASYVKEFSSRPIPYHGYFYRVLTAQGDKAPGGAKSYLNDGLMTAGFAFVACPAKYHNSGVMTFIAGPDGTIYQRDLGSQTGKICRTMTEFNPGPGWQKIVN